MNPTTEFDHLMKHIFTTLFPNGSSRNYFKATPTDNCYQKAVKPDFVIDNTKWIDFKLHVSYREKFDQPWRPSALYASLRKYVDHVHNPLKKLIIVYGKCYWTVDDVDFPVSRGNKVLVHNKSDFLEKVKLVAATKVTEKLIGTPDEWAIRKLHDILRK